MKSRTENIPKRQLWLMAIVLSVGFALSMSSAANARADGGVPKGDPNPTATALSCAPISVQAGQSTHCTAAVSGTIDAIAGEVLFKSENGGKFSDATCTVVFMVKGQPAFCSVDYVAVADGSGKNRLHAIYLGDARNASSEDVFALTILGGEEGGGDDEGGGGKGEGGGKPVPTADARRQARAATAKAKIRRRGCRSHCRPQHGARSGKRG